MIIMVAAIATKARCCHRANLSSFLVQLTMESPNTLADYWGHLNSLAW